MIHGVINVLIIIIIMPVHQITTCTVYHSVTLLLQARNFIFSTNLFHHRLDSWYPSATLLQPVLICLPVFRSSSIFRFFVFVFSYVLQYA